MPKAILFDLDDTLTDRPASLAEYVRDFRSAFKSSLDDAVSEADIASAIAAVDDHGYAPREDVYGALQSRLVWGSVPSLSTLARHWETAFPRMTTFRAGALETVRALRDRGVLTGIVTNGRTHIQRAKIEHLGLTPAVDCVVVSEEAGFAKPDPRVFEKALEWLGCTNRDAWFVGDHPLNDIVGASAAGLMPVWLEGVRPWPVELPEPKCSIVALPDLLGLL